MLSPLAVYVQRLNPFAIRFFDDVGIRWYGLSYLAGFAIAFVVVRALARRGKSTLKPGQVMDFIVAVSLGTVIGGRLGYCIFYKPELLVGFSGGFPFWDLLALNKGGMASHGGLIGVIVAIAWYGRKHGQSPLHLMDLIALSAPIGIFFGRIANFVNGELLGRPCGTELPWCVKFPQEIYEWSAEKLDAPEYRKVVAAVSDQIGHIADPHAVVEAARKHDAIAAMLEPLLTARHPSQLYEALLEGAFLFFLLLIVWARPRKPGVVAGWFLVAYAAVRIAGEQFRLPDAHIANQEFAAWGVTRGQLLSIIMLSIGAACLVYWARRPVSKLGGWATPAGDLKQR